MNSSPGVSAESLPQRGLRTACHAPFTSLYFDTLGDVRVCCHNERHTVGNVTRQTLDDIWHGPSLQALRDALALDDYSLGCDYCHWQLHESGAAGLYARQYDHLPVVQRAPRFPLRMEFSVSNTCNLECIMCRGVWSSSIRSRRERLPPLPKAYGEAFFTQLRAYLPHLREAMFFGGEPFLAAESFRIWDELRQLGLSLPCHVTTNGTQYHAHVEQVLAAFPVSISVSMDGLTKATVERVRQNADFDELMANFRRFHAYARSRGTNIDLTYCLMQQNWEEFGPFLEFADRYGCDVFVNTVITPPECSLYTLPQDQLRQIVETLQAQDAHWQGRLNRNRDAWSRELARLKGRLAGRFENEVYFDSTLAMRLEQLGAAPADAEAMFDKAQADLAAAAVDGRVAVLECGRDDVILSVGAPDEACLGLTAERLVGQRLAALNALFAARFGSPGQVLDQRQTGAALEWTVEFAEAQPAPLSIRAQALPRFDALGAPAGTRLLVARVR